MRYGRIIGHTIKQEGKEALDLVYEFLSEHEVSNRDAVSEIALNEDGIVIYRYLTPEEVDQMVSEGRFPTSGISNEEHPWDADEISYRDDYDYNQLEHLVR